MARIRRVRRLPGQFSSRRESQDVWSAQRRFPVEDFYTKVFEFVKKVKAGGRREERARSEEAQQRIMSGTLDRAELVSELSVLFNYVGCLLYWRGYKDAEHHRHAIKPVQRPPHEHKRFHKAVTRMLEQDMDLEIDEICKELERQRVRGEFNIDWRPEDFGPKGRAWTEKPVPRSIEMAIERIRRNVRTKARASQRQLLLALPKKKGRDR
jgi:hypothetical protein